MGHGQLQKQLRLCALLLGLRILAGSLLKEGAEGSSLVNCLNTHSRAFAFLAKRCAMSFRVCLYAASPPPPRRLA